MLMSRFQLTAAKSLASHHAACVGCQFWQRARFFFSSEAVEMTMCVMGVCIKVTAMLSVLQMPVLVLAVRRRCWRDGRVCCQRDGGKDLDTLNPVSV